MQFLCFMQSAVNDVVLLEYMQQLDHSENTYRTDSLTYVYAQARNPICSNHKSMDPECQYKVVMVDPNHVIIHATDSNQFFSKQTDDTLPEEEQNKFSWGWKEPLIAEWIHMNPAILDTPQTVHDVGDLVGPCGSVGGSHQKILVSYGRGNDGDVLNNRGEVIHTLAWTVSSLPMCLFPHLTMLKGGVVTLSGRIGGKRSSIYQTRMFILLVFSLHWIL
jgi:hypothetical protein